MPTTIFFAGEEGGRALSVTVAEDPAQVADAVRDEAGRPVPLRLADEHETVVFVNPAQIAFWRVMPASTRGPDRDS